MIDAALSHSSLTHTKALHAIEEFLPRIHFFEKSIFKIDIINDHIVKEFDNILKDFHLVKLITDQNVSNTRLIFFIKLNIIKISLI